MANKNYFSKIIVYQLNPGSYFQDYTVICRQLLQEFTIIELRILATATELYAPYK